MTAAEVTRALKAASTHADVARVTRFLSEDAAPGNKVMGVAFGKIFAIARRFSRMPLTEVETPLESPFYEARSHRQLAELRVYATEELDTHVRAALLKARAAT